MCEKIEVLNENTILTKEFLQANPSVIGEQIANLAKSIQENKGDIEEIRDRGWWQKLTTDNTSDLAKAMLKQNETTSAFLTIVQGIIFLSMNNVVVLAGIIQAIEKKEEVDFLKDNTYVNMAKDRLAVAIKSAQKVQNNENDIAKIKEELSSQLEMFENKYVSLVRKFEEQEVIIENLKEKQQNNVNTKQKTIIYFSLILATVALVICSISLFI